MENGTPLLGYPPTVTTTAPDAAVVGTVALMLVADHALTNAATPLKLTLLLPCVLPNAVPEMVTTCPGRPLAGLNPVISGRIENVAPLLFWPFAVTTTGPVVAPLGTTAVMLFELQAETAAVRPLNRTEPDVPKYDPVMVTGVPGTPTTGARLAMMPMTHQ
jgi:hypothetical protein